MIIFFGIAASVMLTLSGVPQAMKSLRQGHSDGLTMELILLVIGGMLFMGIYVFATFGFQPVLHLQHATTISTWLVVLYFKLFPRGAA